MMVFEGTGLIKLPMIALVIAIGLFYKWRIDRNAKIIQETIDAFDLVGLYRKTYSRIYMSKEDSISQQEYEVAASKSESAYRIQMSSYLHQYFTYGQMSAAINQRKVSAIYDGEDILAGMMKTAKAKAADNIEHIKMSLGTNNSDIEVATRRRRRR